ncbi:CapA family protein [Alteribacter aurantiacus]|uniref:CapA family protein n=1 Tax=Alteribacter aurantiacus TaxID=254410 RepID=UPI00040C61CD|nr:CapA family protein [Alteribacter aurantiacus]
MVTDERPLTLKEKHLKRIKKHKKRALRDSLALLAICLTVIASYQLFDHLAADASDTDAPREESELSISMVGDIMLGRYSGEVLNRQGTDYPFAHAKPIFDQTDIVTGNFEHPILIGDPSEYEDVRLDKDITLHANLDAANAVKQAGFTHVNLANNHMSDYGIVGMYDTLETFNRLDIPTTGAGLNIDQAREIHYEQVNGMTVATLGFNDAYMTNERRATATQEGVVPMEPEYVIEDIKEANENADFVIVHAHWGEEYDNTVHPRQRELAEAMAQAGADVIAGHHAHTLQPIEVIDNTVVIYGLGNFVFDQGWSMTRETAVVQYDLYSDRAEVTVHPMYIEESQPRPATNRYRQEKIFNSISTDFVFTDSFNDTWTRDEGRLVKTIER